MFKSLTPYHSYTLSHFVVSYKVAFCFGAAWNRVIATAVEHGQIGERVPVPKLGDKGHEGTPRPAFSKLGINQLLALMDPWHGGAKPIEREMRPLPRDYVEICC